MGKHVVVGVARESREARVVVVQAGVVRRSLEATADGFERVRVPLFAVGVMDSLWNGHASPQSIAWYASPGVPPRARTVPSPVAFRRDSGPTNTSVPGGASTTSPSTSKVAFPSSTMYSSSWPEPGLVVLADQRAVLAGRVGVDSECVDPEVLADRNISAAPLDVVEVCDLPVRAVVHPIASFCVRRFECRSYRRRVRRLKRECTQVRRSVADDFSLVCQSLIRTSKERSRLHR
jgi:hypothetical protein